MERIGKHFDELAEVHALIGNVIEYGFIAVALILYVANFHVEFETFGDLARLNHSVVFASLGFLEFFDVGRLGFAVDAFDLGIGLDVGALHLKHNQFAGHCNCTDIVSGRCFNDYHVTGFEGQIGAVAVESLAGILELHLYDVEVGKAARNVLEPIVAMQFASGCCSTVASICGSRGDNAQFLVLVFGVIYLVVNHL